VPVLAKSARLASVLVSAGLVLGVGGLPGAAPLAEVNRGEYAFLIDGWQTQDGLPENTVNSILQTREGYLWVGTIGGLARFDGVRFVTFGAQNSEGFRHSWISGLYESRQGDLWIASDGGGVTRYHEGRFTNYGIAQGLASDSVDCLGEDEEAGVWMRNRFGDGFNRWHDGKITARARQDLPANLTLRAFQTNGPGEVWIRKGSTLECRLPQRLVQLGGYSAVQEDRNGCLWVYGSRFAARLRANGGAGQEIRADPVLEDNVRCLCEGKAGDIWAGAWTHGLFHWREGQGSAFRKVKGIADGQVRTIYEDREGIVWVGTTAGGLNRLRPRTIDLHSAEGGVTGKDVLTVAESSARRLWIGTYRDGLFYGDQEGGRYRRFSPLAGPFDQFNIFSVCPAHDGALWVATWGGGLFKITEKQQPVQFSRKDGLSDDRIVALHEDQDGSLWIGTYLGGLDHFDGKSFTTYGVREGLNAKHLTSILRRRNGTLWVGSNSGGVFRMEQGRFIGFSMKDGLASGLVLALHEDEEGRLWIGTRADGGLSRLAGGRCFNFTRECGLPAKAVMEILEDDLGSFWLGSDSGIIRVSKQELNDLADGKTAWLHAVTYGEKDGLSNVECRGGSQPAVCKTGDGRLWFATHVGVATIDPPAIQAATVVAPPVIIEDVVVDGRQLKPPSWRRTVPRSARDQAQPFDLELLAGERAFQIHFTALNLGAPEKIQFKYRMEGLDKHWTEVGWRRVAPYQYLPPGDYRFEVAACNESGLWSQSPATLTLRLLPSFRETRWFLGLIISAAALGAGAGVRVVTQRRARRKLEQLERQQVLALERMRIARDIHDEVGSSLTKISKLAEALGHQDGAAAGGDSRVSAIAETVRKTVQAMDEIVWAINPKNDTLESMSNYLVHTAKEFLRSSTIRCRLEVPLGLPAISVSAAVRHALLMAVKEALNNAVKHAAPREVRLGLECVEDALTIEVVDDGKGFDAGSVARGDGLEIMHKRLRSVGGELRVQSEPGRGTTVRMRLRL
jgi:signal transduction histidine kinase/ligand-binding sensor domain-containing protein